MFIYYYRCMHNGGWFILVNDVNYPIIHGLVPIMGPLQLMIHWALYTGMLYFR